MSLSTRKILAGIAASSLWCFNGYADHFYTVYEQLNRPEAAAESTCWEVDLEKLVPSTKWNRAENQGLLPWCSAYADANVITFETGISVSGAFIALRQESIKERAKADAQQSTDVYQDLRGGENLGICDIVKTVNEYGFCPEAIIEEAELAAENISQAWSKSKTFGFIDYANNLTTTACDRKVIPVRSPLSCGYYFPSKSASMPGTLDQLLESGYMPILVFNEKPLYSPWVEGPEIAPHAVPIAGRRWNKTRNRCEYKIRNSIQFTSCDAYNDRVTCNPTEVSAGEVWIDTSMIDETTYEIVQIGQARSREMPVKHEGRTELNPQKSFRKSDNSGFISGATGVGD